MTAKELGSQSAYPSSIETTPGMTIRQRFALEILGGMMACDSCVGEPGELASSAIDFADALLAELAKEQSE